ncbi:hypothetical protein BSL78_06261 [Apostichopus japonicus]|uniref:Uncharacterized protein n=1 Tax=Stichopus japonicus TaxID=307972 RepID=A0A2G8L9B5_STIJA|nr:hypothetical protein BSL78_06261 [Apostichopus japonicus]
MVADGGYPLPVASSWLGCPDDDPGVNWIEVCNPDLCSLGSECLSGNFDTITRTSDGNTYAFQGGLVAQLTEDGNGIVSGYPKPICNVFPGLPSNLDASILYPTGSHILAHHWYHPRQWLPKGHCDEFCWVPTDLDAASLYGDSGNAYFFKGDEYWRYDVRKSRVEHTLPMAIRVGWPGIGPPVDAAFQSSNGRQYFFSGDRYYRQENNSYPLDRASNWLECSNGDHGMGWIDVDDDRELCSLTSGRL